MAQSSFALLTNTGRAKEAAALANATTIEITHIAIGDGATVPSGGETALYNEVARKTISGHGTVTGAENVAYFDAYLAAGDGPFTIREAGLYDSEGDLIAIAHYDPPISKPVPASGQTVEGTVRIEVAFSNIATVVIKVDPSMQVALQRLTQLPWIAVMELGRNDPPATPVPGDVYVIGGDPTGTWAGHAGKVAEYTIAGWALLAPRDGHGVGLPDGRVFERVGGVYVEKIALDVQSGKWLYATAGGTANALTATLDPIPAAYAAGMAVRLKIATSNTGAATLNVSGLGAKSIRRADGLELSPGDLTPGQIIHLVYDGVVFRFAGSARSEMWQLTLSPLTTSKFTTPGSHGFTVPAGVTSILARAWGGGGGGGVYANSTSNQQGSPSGGSGAAYAERRFVVAPGQIINISVGAGGVGGDATVPRNPSNGQSSTVTVGVVTMTAGGGPAGKNQGGPGTASASGGGLYSNAEFGLNGESGLIGISPGGTVLASGGYGGAAPLGGMSVPGGYGTSWDGDIPGGGGGSTSDYYKEGGDGARGEVHIVYASIEI